MIELWGPLAHHQLAQVYSDYTQQKLESILGVWNAEIDEWVTTAAAVFTTFKDRIKDTIPISQQMHLFAEKPIRVRLGSPKKPAQLIPLEQLFAYITQKVYMDKYLTPAHDNQYAALSLSTSIFRQIRDLIGQNSRIPLTENDRMNLLFNLEGLQLIADLPQMSNTENLSKHLQNKRNHLSKYLKHTLAKFFPTLSEDSRRTVVIRTFVLRIWAQWDLSESFKEDAEFEQKV